MKVSTASIWLCLNFFVAFALAAAPHLKQKKLLPEQKKWIPAIRAVANKTLVRVKNWL